MKQQATFALFVLLLDTALGWIYWTALLLLRCPSCTGLVGLWSFGAAKWICFYYLTSVLTDGKSDPILRRLVYLLCLLCPVIETGRMLMSQTDRPYMGPSPDLTRVPLSTLISLLACLIWEKGLCDQKSTRRKPQIEGASQLLTRMVNFFKDDVFYLTAAFDALIVAVICETCIPLYQGEVIDMLSASMVQTSFYYAIMKLVLVSIGSAMFSGVRGGLFMFSLARLNRRLKHLLFHSLLQQEIQFFDKPGELSSRLHSDVDRMGRTVALNANALVRSFFKTCLTLAVMFRLSWELTVITFLEMPLLALVQNKWTTLSAEMKNQIQAHKAQISDLVFKSLSRIEIVRSFNGENVELKRYNTAVQQLSAVKRQYGIYSTAFGLIRRMVSLVMRLMFFVLARRLILANQLSIGSLVTCLLYQKPMSYNLREIMYGYGDTMSTVGVISKVFSYLDRKPKRKTAGHLAPEKLEGRIVFENVSFTSPSESVEKTALSALKSVSMELLPGKMTALIGPSGSGKTTCVSLLKRLYEPQEGQILLDGRPLHEYDLKYLHKKMALVSQNPELFRGSLNYNIEYGLKESNMEKVQETAKRINAELLFSDLDEGYDKDVGELAAGMKQSVAILRALIRDPQVIILDEATSKLDVIAQDAVLEEIRSRGQTVLVVTHQLKTVEEAHQIIFLENGEIVEKGTHQELMDKKGRYYSFKEELFKT